jgi:hypothetical protein
MTGISVSGVSPHPDASLSMVLAGTVYALVHRVRTVKGATIKTTRWIDALSRVARLLVWAGISLVAAVTVVLAEYLISGSFPGWSWVVLFATLMTASGNAGSTIRNRSHKRSEV